MSIIITTKPTSRANLREYTKSLRSMVEYGEQIYFDIIRFLEYDLPIIAPSSNVEYWSGDNLPYQGVTNPYHNYIFIREDVYLGAINGVFGDRMTIAHEIGHLLIHSGKNACFLRKDLNPYVSKQEKIYLDPEWQAAVFAGELLVPYHLTKDIMSIKELSSKCGVSYEAAKIQMKHRN